MSVSFYIFMSLFAYVSGDDSVNPFLRIYVFALHTATRCNTLQHTATRCNTLQHTATHCNTLLFCMCMFPVLHAATHCNTLQHIATHCNTLQHTLFWHIHVFCICLFWHVCVSCSHMYHSFYIYMSLFTYACLFLHIFVSDIDLPLVKISFDIHRSLLTYTSLFLHVHVSFYIYLPLIFTCFS